MTAITKPRTGRDLLGVYLNDHLAGATAGLELARRMAAAAAPGSELAAVMRQLVTEIAVDRKTLIEIMATLEVPLRGYKMFAGWAGEKAARLKLNGHLLTRSPLSDLEEAEMLRLGVEGKAAGWRTLRTLSERDSRLDGRRLDALIERAARQSETLETLRVSIAAQLVSGV
jgi:hypothetical protein